MGKLGLAQQRLRQLGLALQQQEVFRHTVGHTIQATDPQLQGDVYTGEVKNLQGRMA